MTTSAAFPQTFCSIDCTPDENAIIQADYEGYGLENFEKIYNATESTFRSLGSYWYQNLIEQTIHPCTVLSSAANKFFELVNSYPNMNINRDSLPDYARCMFQEKAHLYEKISEAEKDGFIKFVSNKPSLISAGTLAFNLALTGILSYALYNQVRQFRQFIPMTPWQKISLLFSVATTGYGLLFLAGSTLSDASRHITYLGSSLFE